LSALAKSKALLPFGAYDARARAKQFHEQVSPKRKGPIGPFLLFEVLPSGA
jgi:hypothetical protein